MNDSSAGGTGHPAADVGFRSGFAAFVGRPNAGKSTLTNALVGQKIAITSDRPQTTRHSIRGIVHRHDAQLVLVDTPGVHRPRTVLGQRLNDIVAESLAEVDIIGVVLPANEKTGPGDRFIADQVGAVVAGRPDPPVVVAVLTKQDLVSRDVVAQRLVAAAELVAMAVDIVPVSAVTGFQVDALTDVLLSHLPAGPPLYPDGDLTDEPEERLIAEFVREAALQDVREELPHSLAVVVEETVPRAGRDDGLLDVRVNLFVERDSQKGIVIGKGGARLREVGTRARRHIQALLGVPVFLDLHVKVAKDWQRDPKQLRRLGF
ncbi:MAG: GTPase Era [Micrococcales bacterium]|nr:MAG: GTPase Era [Micrococcales bacterium]